LLPIWISFDFILRFTLHDYRTSIARVFLLPQYARGETSLTMAILCKSSTFAWALNKSMSRVYTIDLWVKRFKRFDDNRSNLFCIPPRFTWPYKSWWLRFNQNNVFYIVNTIDQKSNFYAQCRIVRLLCSRLSHIQLCPWDSLKYLCAQCNCATVGLILHSVAITGIVITTFLAIVWAHEKIRTCVSIAIERAATCKRVLYCKNRSPCCTSVLCGNAKLFCQQLLLQHCG